MDEKRMPFMNFKIVNAKYLKMEFKKAAKIWHIYMAYLFSEILMIGWRTEI